VTFHQHAADVHLAKAQLAEALKKDELPQPQAIASTEGLPHADVTPFSPKSKTGGGYTFTKA
jgi:hypothetical protein